MKIRITSMSLVALLVLAACSQGTPGSSGRPSGSKTVTVLGTWGGSEQDSFLAMVRPFEDRTGIKVQYEGTRDLNAVLQTRVQGNNAPDIAGLPGPGQMADFAKAGKLVDLGGVLDQAQMTSDYSDDWLKLGQVNGKQYGIFIKASLKGLIWYNPTSFQAKGLTVPKSWDDLMAQSKKVADSGSTPWCIGLESGAASGWPGTDWIEDLMLRQSGPEKYDQWYQGTLKWTAPEVKAAWTAFGAIVNDPKMTYGGKAAVLSTNFGDAGNPLFTTPPGCYMHHQASFITDFFVKAKPDLKPVTDFTFFPFPDINTSYSGAVEAGGDLFGMFKDTTNARELMKYLTTAEAQQIWVSRGGALSPNKKVALSAYPDDLSRQSAQILVSAKITRFDASDLMPEAMNNAFWKAILDWVSDPTKLDTILGNLDKVQAEAYKK